MKNEKKTKNRSLADIINGIQLTKISTTITSQNQDYNWITMVCACDIAARSYPSLYYDRKCKTLSGAPLVKYT